MSDAAVRFLLGVAAVLGPAYAIAAVSVGLGPRLRGRIPSQHMGHNLDVQDCRTVHPSCNNEKRYCKVGV
ncbi:hypothetical protein J3A74_000187 [Rhodococcus sp. PvP104]|nr:hypothetical protein [Rhodococcus sp. PvP104]